MTQSQKYAIATAMATTSFSVVVERLGDNQEAILFATSISKFYRKRDGFVPKRVRDLIFKGK